MNAMQIHGIACELALRCPVVYSWVFLNEIVTFLQFIRVLDCGDSIVSVIVFIIYVVLLLPFGCVSWRLFSTWGFVGHVCL